MVASAVGCSLEVLNNLMVGTSSFYRVLLQQQQHRRVRLLSALTRAIFFPSSTPHSCLW